MEVTPKPCPGEFLRFEERTSPSPWVERVWRSRSERAGVFHSMAAIHWEMVVTRLRDRLCLTVRGPETRASIATCPAEGQWVGIRFRLGTFMPALPAMHVMDRRDATLPGAGRWFYWRDGSRWEYPAFENAETFVERLAKAGIIARDPRVVAETGEPPSAVSRRTGQRRFLRTTGLTETLVGQIERARVAAFLLRRGLSALDVVEEAGFYDQSHLNRSMVRFIGRTPGQIIRGDSQLSFLYNTQGEGTSRIGHHANLRFGHRHAATDLERPGLDRVDRQRIDHCLSVV